MPSDMRYLHDPGSLTPRLTGSPEERGLLREIEQGDYVAADMFMDRFGRTLGVSELSAGCKTGLAVLRYPDRLINLQECGDNAISAILAHCREGYVVMREPWTTMPRPRGTNPEIQVQLGDYWFDNLRRFSDHFEEEYPNPPRLFGGAYHV